MRRQCCVLAKCARVQTRCGNATGRAQRCARLRPNGQDVGRERAARAGDDRASRAPGRASGHTGRRSAWSARNSSGVPRSMRRARKERLAVEGGWRSAAPSRRLRSLSTSRGATAKSAKRAEMASSPSGSRPGTGSHADGPKSDPRAAVMAASDAQRGDRLPPSVSIAVAG